MKNLKEAYKFLDKYITNGRIKDEDKFTNLFLLVCSLIDTLSVGNEVEREKILNALNEFDFEKNREVK